MKPFLKRPLFAALARVLGIDVPEPPREAVAAPFPALEAKAGSPAPDVRPIGKGRHSGDEYGPAPCWKLVLGLPPICPHNLRRRDKTRAGWRTRTEFACRLGSIMPAFPTRAQKRRQAARCAASRKHWGKTIAAWRSASIQRDRMMSEILERKAVA